MANWVSDLDNMLYTYLKYKIQKKYSATHPDIRVTKSAKSPTTPKFPNIYIKVLGNGDVGATFDYGSNGVTYDVQIEVTTLEEDDARSIMDFVVECMQMKYFRISVNSLENNTDNAFGRVSRFSRIIGANNTF